MNRERERHTAPANSSDERGVSRSASSAGRRKRSGSRPSSPLRVVTASSAGGRGMGRRGEGRGGGLAGSSLMRCALAVVAAAVLFAAGPCEATTKPYASRDDVPVIANNVFPYNNPAETYKYYSLPFCRPKTSERERQRFGEMLVGDRKVSTDYKLSFGVDMSIMRLCMHTLSPDELRQLSEAVKEGYYFEFFVDDLPVEGPIGQVIGHDIHVPLGLWQGAAKVELYSHINFVIGYNGDRIVSVTTSPHEPESDQSRYVDISNTDSEIEVEFTYSVVWREEDTPFSARMDKLAGGGFLPETFEIHWLSIINSFVLVVILTVFLGIILLRILKKDFTRYMDGDEDDIGEEESGWKLIHGDVFRFPSHVNLFAALTGAGAQLCVVTISLLLCALLGVFRPTKRGSILTCILVLYSLTAWVSGLMSARLYRQLGGGKWVWNAITSSLVFPLPLLGVFSVVNTIAISQSSTAALPFYPVMVIVAMFVFIVFPMTVIGAIIGRNTTSDFQAPCRTTRVPRQVPKDVPWYRRDASQMVMSGFLPFSAIYIELHYIFASVWGHQIYTLFGILILAFLLLLVVCSFITVSLIYFQLGREDHRWWWRSFFSGGSTGLFVYAYSFFYFFNRSQMDGLLQSSFYFGYMAVISYAFFIMLGFVGFVSSLTFVKHIYSVLKCD
ncbi:unnamed protein product [Ectocarpus sp. 12 AP-2014]